MGTNSFEKKQPIKPGCIEKKIITGSENYSEAPVCNKSISGNDNYIIAEIEIGENSVNKDIRIINSYESFERKRNKTTFDEKLRNEIEIRKCKIFIEGNLIPFSYNYKFDKTGTFTIKYCFQNNIKSLYGLFCECDYLKTLNFSNFNSNDAISTEYMFYYCLSLSKLNLTNFNTDNVTDMQRMFSYCYSIKELNLSSFNTNNVTSMEYMFQYCLRLTDLDLSNFKTQKNTYVGNMFYGCEHLTKSLLICYDEKILKAASSLK